MKKSGLLASSALRAAALVGASLGLAAPALAQDGPATQTESEDPIANSGDVAMQDTLPRTDAQGNPPEGEAIVVTGSRIRRNETTSASPLQIIDPVLAQRQGRFDTAEVVQNSPMALGSTQITSAVSSNTVSNGGPGSQTISLRGLGASRTLILLNGRRAGPAGTRGAISSFDLNVIPSTVIRSVEILKDGASSVYGSDAVAGVVNLITKRSTDGIEFTGHSSVPVHGGGETYNATAAWGKDFGRGHILVAADIYKRRELKRRDRDFLGCPVDYFFRTEKGGERADLVDPRTGDYACINGTAWGHIWAYGFASSNLPDDPTLFQYSYNNDNLGAYTPKIPAPTFPGDLLVPPGWFPVSVEGNAPSNAVFNAYHPFEQKASVIPETTRYTLYGDASFEISDSIEFYAEGLFNRRRTFVDSYTQIYNFGYTDLYAPGDRDDPFPGWTAPRGGNAYISPTGIYDRSDQTTTVDYYRGVGGIRGSIGKNWRYDVVGQYSLSKGKYKLQQVLRDVIDQQTDRAYGYGCAGLFTTFSKRPCLQVNWVDPGFMAGELTDAELAYFGEDEVGRTKYEQKYAEASLSGDLFRLPAGPVGIALGATIRRDEIDDLPGHVTLTPNPFYNPALAPNDPKCANQVGQRTQPCNEFVDNAFNNTFASGHTFGHSVTKEAFGEINIPIFKDQPFARSFEISGAARVTNVKAVRGSDGASDSFKGNWTYKAMANWQVFDWIRLRATYGTSFRAPALFEQFLAAQVSGARQTIDPCRRYGQNLSDGNISQRVADNCASQGIPPNHTGAGLQITVRTSGGLGNLDPETSKSKTASIILTPRFSFLPDTDLALTVDYFDITVNGEIALLTNSAILLGCYESDNFPNDPRCGLFTRGQEGNPNNIKEIRRQYINIDEQINRGFDFTFRVLQNMGNLGKLSLLAQATLQTKDTVSRQGELDDLNGRIGEPKFSGTANLNWERGNTNVNYGLTFIGKSSSEQDFIELNGKLCNVTPTGVAIYGDYCYRIRTKAYSMHSASITQRIADDKLELTLGVTNLFDKKPPAVGAGAGSFQVGNTSYLMSQYDWLGRRVFVGARAKF